MATATTVDRMTSSSPPLALYYIDAADVLYESPTPLGTTGALMAITKGAVLLRTTSVLHNGAEKRGYVPLEMRCNFARVRHTIARL